MFLFGSGRMQFRLCTRLVCLMWTALMHLKSQLRSRRSLNKQSHCVFSYESPQHVYVQVTQAHLALACTLIKKKLLRIFSSEEKPSQADGRNRLRLSGRLCRLKHSSSPSVLLSHLLFLFRGFIYSIPLLRRETVGHGFICCQSGKSRSSPVHPQFG